MTVQRPPEQVMRLNRLGASHQTRLSFMRTLLRKLKQENWQFDRPDWDIDDNGVGHAVYRAIGPRRTYSLIAYAHDLPAHLRSDRVIAEAWDATFTLYDGTPSAADIKRLESQVPLQEAGRISDTELSLSRANRSVRLWEHVVDCLSRGVQPDRAQLADVGYLMRTTAVYGSGKFGAKDHAAMHDRTVMSGPFRAEMLSVWLTRAFVADLVEHMARVRGGSDATVLSKENRELLGIGNSTGLGMAPFLVNHPALLHQWIDAREEAIARVRRVKRATAQEIEHFKSCFQRAEAMLSNWNSDHPIMIGQMQDLNGDCKKIGARIAGHFSPDNDFPWDDLVKWSEEALTFEGQEFLAALICEPYGHLVDELADRMHCDESRVFPIDGSWSMDKLRDALRQNFGWALERNYAERENCGRFWYVSEAKLEPRLGERFDEPGGELEQPLDIARRAAALWKATAGMSGDVADLLDTHPEFRRMVRRVQIAASRPYSEIQDNLISAGIRPIDMLRCKLSFFGATRFDPRSDRWLRITMFQNAPYPHGLASAPEDEWVLPPHSTQGSGVSQ